MSLPVVLTTDAEREIDEAAQRYESLSATLGVNLVIRVRETLGRIETLPYLYPEVSDGIRRAAIRRFPYGIFYTIKSDRVEVFAVLHNYRDPSSWQERGSKQNN